MKKIFAVLFFATIAAQVFLTNSLVIKGRRMDELAAEKEILQSRLLELDNQIAQASSLSSIREKAKNMGMRPGKLKHLPPQPVALKP